MRDTVKKYVLLVELKKNSQSKEMCQTSVKSTEVKGMCTYCYLKSNLIEHLINTLTPSILPCWV